MRDWRLWGGRQLEVERERDCEEVKKKGLHRSKERLCREKSTEKELERLQ